MVYFAATIVAIGFWLVFNRTMLLKRQVTVPSVLLLVTVPGVAWAIVRFGMG